MEIGIIGFGQLGKFIAKHLVQEGIDVWVTDILDKKEEAEKIQVRFSTFEEIAKKDIVIISVPINKFNQVIEKVNPILKENALVIDVCSVKEMPAQVMRKKLRKDVEIIASHHLFGPQSGANGIEGLKITLCPIRTKRLEEIKRFLENMGLKVIVTNPKEHDKEMATGACLSHFIGRCLMDLEINDQEISEPSFKKLLELKEMLEEDSEDLFRDIQKNNRFAKDIREKFIEVAEKINAQLK